MCLLAQVYPVRKQNYQMKRLVMGYKNIFLLFFLSFLLMIVYTSQLFADVRFAFSEELYNKVLSVYNKSAENRVRQWQQVLFENTGSDTADQLYEINRFFNRLEFVDDLTHWNKNDYWATPVEFLATNGGDCEDFTIAKYFSLRALGVPTEKLRLMYVKALRYDMAHMVLAYYETPLSIPLVLDNLNPDILPANKRRDLKPVYSFNGDGLWIAKEKGQGKQVQKGGNNNLWEDLNKRMIQESNNNKDK